jgi:hypothetical protein
MELEELQYPIGRFSRSFDVTSELREQRLRVIEATPAELHRVVAGLTDEQLDTPYRAEGWTVRQVVHHYADDHMNSYIRFKLALTEETPTIKPYSEPLWGDLPDARRMPVEPSLALLAGLHERWIAAWRALALADWSRAFIHPRSGLAVSLDTLAAQYDWHGRHHVAQIRALRERSGWGRAREK